MTHPHTFLDSPACLGDHIHSVVLFRCQAVRRHCDTRAGTPALGGWHGLFIELLKMPTRTECFVLLRML